MDFLRKLLDRTKNPDNNTEIEVYGNLLRQELGESAEVENINPGTSANLDLTEPENGLILKQLANTSYLPTDKVVAENRVQGDGSKARQELFLLGNGIVPETTSNIPTTNAPHAQGMRMSTDTRSLPLIGDPVLLHGGKKHVVSVSLPAAITICVTIEVFFLVIIFFVVLAQARRARKRCDVEFGEDDDLRKGDKSEEPSSGIICSTSTPFNSHRGAIYPGMSSAMSDNLHYMMPLMSPIEMDRSKRCTFSAATATLTPTFPADVKPKRVQCALSEERPRSSTWLDMNFESKRALYAIGRSESTPDHLSSRSASCTGVEIDTPIGKLEPKIYKQEELAAKVISRWRQKSKMKEPSKLFFKVHYDVEIELLTIFLSNATNLQISIKNGTGDIFVKIALDPDHKRRSMSSTIQHGKHNPDFNQNFGFRIAKCAVSEMSVKFTMCEYDRFSHTVPIGQVVFALSGLNYDEMGDREGQKMMGRDLEKPEKEDEETSRGELMISLTYLPNAERVNLIIMKARKLRLPEWGDKEVGSSILDTFVKITIMRCGKVMKHKNTKVVKRSCSPIYNEAFSIDRMRLSEMPECCFVISVCVRLNHFRSHRVIGRCVVGGKDCAVGDGLAHWNEMSDSPRSIVARWHKIQF